MTDQPTADAKKVAFKTELLIKLGLATGLATAFGPRVHMVRPATKPGRRHRIMCDDGGWIEIDPEGKNIRTWGSGRTARDFVAAIKADDDAFAIEHLEPTATAAAPGAPRRLQPVLSDDRLSEIAESWRARHYADIEMVDDGVWIGVGDTRLFDIGDRVTIHGPVTDEAIFALVGKSMDAWDSKLRLFGTWSDDDRERVWLCCQRHNVSLSEYQPSVALIARWEAERDAAGAGAGKALMPDHPAAKSAGPLPSVTGGAAVQKAQEPATDRDLTAFDRQAVSLDRRQAEIDERQLMTIKERVDQLLRTERLDLRAAQARAFEEQEQLRQTETRIAEAREILARARALAIEKGLDYESAIAVAKAEHLAERENGYQPRSGLRR